MARTDPQMNIRLPAELKRWIEKSAAQNNRSMNAEIIHRLQETIQSDIDKIDLYRHIDPSLENNPEADPLEDYLGSKEMLGIFEVKMRELLAEAISMASENKKKNQK